MKNRMRKVVYYTICVLFFMVMILTLSMSTYTGLFTMILIYGANDGWQLCLTHFLLCVFVYIAVYLLYTKIIRRIKYG